MQTEGVLRKQRFGFWPTREYWKSISLTPRLKLLQAVAVLASMILAWAMVFLALPALGSPSLIVQIAMAVLLAAVGHLLGLGLIERAERRRLAGR